MTAEGRERFFRSIAERIDPERVEEVHLFPSIRQGARESGVAVLTLRREVPADETPEATPADEPQDETAVSDCVGIDDSAVPEVPEEASDGPLVPPDAPNRFTVLRANYVLTLKGPERGKWEVGVVEEADAPAATVDEVVRGVHERAGGWEDGSEIPERFSGDDFRAALAEEQWTAAR